MNVIKTAIEGVVILEPRVFNDVRAGEARALREGSSARCGGGHPQGLAYLWPACGRGTDGGQSPAAVHTPRVRPRLRGAIRHRCVPV